MKTSFYIKAYVGIFIVSLQIIVPNLQATESSSNEEIEK